MVHRRPTSRPALLLLGLLLAVLPAAGARGQSFDELREMGIPIPTDPGNAATWYVRAVDELARVAPRQADVIANWDHATPPTRALRAAIRAHAAVLADVESATARTRCDFELRYDRGWEMQLPHLARLRQVARVVRARALVAMHDGRPDAAVRDVERVQRMAVHAAGDDILISSLVSMAIAAMGDELVAIGLGRGVFGPAEAARLLGVVGELAAPGAFRVRAAIASEAAISGAWLRDRLLDATPEERVSFATDLLGVGPDSEEATAIRDTSDAVYEEQIGSMEAAYADAVELVDRFEEDPEAVRDELEAWEQSIAEGAYGQLAALMMPSLSRVMERAAASRTAMAETEATLRRVIGGDPSARRLGAAVHLRAAIEAAAAIPDEHVETIVLGGGVLGDDEAADAARASLRRVLEHLAAAADAAAAEADAAPAARLWTDDAVLRADGDSTVIPAWAAGARRALRLLAGEAARRLDESETPGGPDAGAAAVAAAGLVTDGLRLVRLLATMRPMIASRLAHEHLADLVPLVRDLPAAGRTDEAAWAPLAAAAEALAPGTPEEDRPRWRGRTHAVLGYPAKAIDLRQVAGQAARDLRDRMAGRRPEPGWDPDEANALDGDMATILLLATERVAGGVYGPVAPVAGTSDLPPGPGEAAGDEDGAAPDDGADAPDPEAAAAPPEATDRMPDVAGLEGLVDAEALAVLESRVREIRRRIVEHLDPLALVAGPDASPLDLRRHQRDARRLVRELRRAVDPDRADEPEGDAEDGGEAAAARAAGNAAAPAGGA